MIKGLPLDKNPREKALHYGIESLTDIELLALILRTGNKQESVLELSERVLLEIGGIEFLMHTSYAALTSIKGIKNAKAIEIMSLVEIAKRLKNIKGRNYIIEKPNDIFDYVKDEMMFLKQEHFVVMCLDNRNKVLKIKTLFIGSINMSVVTPREVFMEAIAINSAKIIIIHNHPSGEVIPSKEDHLLTQQFDELGQMMSIELVDHIIIGWNQYYSFKAKEIIVL